jgi:hypothetical protein
MKDDGKKKEAQRGKQQLAATSNTSAGLPELDPDWAKLST